MDIYESTPFIINGQMVYYKWTYMKVLRLLLEWAYMKVLPYMKVLQV